MILMDAPEVKPTSEGITLTLKFDKLSRYEVLNLAERIEPLAGKKVDVSVKRHHDKRTLDANAYAWTKMGELAAVQGLKKEEVYRNYIRDCGAYEIVPIRDDAVERWMENWSARGLGWMCESLGACRNTRGYQNIVSYYGSSVYDKKEMSRLIDAIVFDCKDCGIETATPDEIEHLKSMWGGRK